MTVSILVPPGRKGFKALLLATLVIFTFVGTSHAEWKHRLTPYLMGASLEGTVGAAGQEVDVDLSASDLLSNLEFGFMINYRAETDRFSIGFDGLYTGLGATLESPSAEVDVDQYMIEVTGGYRAAPPVEILAGIRYNRLSNAIDFRGPLATQVSASKDWVDPIVGARFTAPLSAKWSFRGRADIGGFGIGSDLTWQLGGYLDVRLSPRSSLQFGYRLLDTDYESGSGLSRFKYDTLVSGPAFGLSLHF